MFIGQFEQACLDFARPRGSRDKRKRKRKKITTIKLDTKGLLTTGAIAGGTILAVNPKLRKNAIRGLKRESKLVEQDLKISRQKFNTGRIKLKKAKRNIAGQISAFKSRKTQRRARKNLEKSFKQK